ncbi:MAG: SMI1/KNR4 family protein [Holophagales bacterium]|nr:SMI1/KNR4 family protein [Holophagales bacterium]
MNWESKLAKLRGLEGEREELAIIFGSAPSASAEALDAIRRDVAGVPAEYIDFLRQTDGLQIDMNVLAGSGGSGFPSLKRLDARWRPVIGERGGCVVGEDAAGAAFLVTPSGAISLVDADPPHRVRTIASSFEEFLGEVLLGPRYQDLFPNGLYEGNEWWPLLRAEGWA